MEFLEHLSKFFSAHFPNKSYIVGGYNRDKKLNLPPKDIDIVIEQEGGALKAAETLKELYPNEIEYFQVGSSYPIYKVHFKAFNEIVDISDTQTEYFPDPTSRQRKTIYADLKQDLLRRDFSINTICWDLTNKHYCYFSTQVIDDLKNNVIDCLDEVNPDVMFDNDPLRILRMARFAIKYNFTVSQRLLKSAEKNLHRIGIVSKERVQEELMKICDCPKGLYKLLTQFENIFEFIFPFYSEMKNVRQHPENGWDVRNIHLEGLFVSDHVKECLNNLKDNQTGIIQLAVLFHDIGKLKTRTEKNGKCQFIQHERVGVPLAEKILKEMKFSNKEIDIISTCIKYHMDVHRIENVLQIKKLIRKIADFEKTVMLFKVAEIDNLGTKAERESDDYHVLYLDMKLIYHYLTPVFISGDVICQIFNCKPCVGVGKAKQICLDMQDEFRLRDGFALIWYMKQFNSLKDFVSNPKRNIKKLKDMLQLLEKDSIKT